MYVNNITRWVLTIAGQSFRPEVVFESLISFGFPVMRFGVTSAGPGTSSRALMVQLFTCSYSKLICKSPYMIFLTCDNVI